MKELTLREIQLKELDILTKFDEVCRKLGIHYYLAYGTLLGAVRHKGFIPWDDDVDVYVPRKDYELLILEFNNVVGNDSTFRLEPYVEGSKYYTFAKIVDLNTLIDRPSAYITEPKKLWIDIFPLDEVPNSKVFRKLHLKWSVFLFTIFCMAITNPNSESRTKGLMGKWNSFWGSLYRRIGIDRLQKWIIRNSKKFEGKGKNYVGCTTFCLEKENEAFPFEYISNGRYLDFEGKKFMAFSNPEEYLTQIYGDFMKIPPKEKQINHKMKAWEV